LSRRKGIVRKGLGTLATLIAAKKIAKKVGLTSKRVTTAHDLFPALQDERLAVKRLEY